MFVQGLSGQPPSNAAGLLLRDGTRPERIERDRTTEAAA
jgi:hypothetical protein